MTTKCGFSAGTYLDQFKWAVLEPINIADIPNADKLFHSMATRDQAGSPTNYATPCNGAVKGDISGKAGLPIYTFEILGADGRLHKRTLVAQNPTTAAKTAARARNGERIFWLIDADRANGDDGKWMGMFYIEANVQQPTVQSIKFWDKRS